jgi:hypothetical protein
MIGVASPGEDKLVLAHDAVVALEAVMVLLVPCQGDGAMMADETEGGGLDHRPS